MRLRGRLGRAWRVAARTFGGYSADQGALLAGALAFFAFLSLFPFLLVVIAILGSVLGSSDRAYAAVVDVVQGALPGSRLAVEEQVRAVISQRVVAGWLGVAGLLYGALGFFSMWRTSLQVIWRLPPPARFWRPYVRAVLVVLAAIVFVLASIAATAVLTAILQYRAFGFSLRQIPHSVTIVGVLVSLALDWGAFTLAYLAAGNRRLTWGGRLAGAGFAAVAWEIAKHLFAWYVTSFASFAVYGSLGVVVILMIWFYYSAVILVLGAELAAAWSDPAPEGHLPLRV